MDESEVLKFEQPAKVFKLSEAIRVGAKLRPQCFGFLFRDGASCALGAAYEALGGIPIDGDASDPAYCKIYDQLEGRFGSDICYEAHDRNDRGASREAVADWLESEGY